MNLRREYIVELCIDFVSNICVQVYSLLMHVYM